MKEKKKVKRFKRILPFICATLLLLGSCMTVCASATVYHLPTGITDKVDEVFGSSEFNYIIFKSDSEYHFYAIPIESCFYYYSPYVRTNANNFITAVSSDGSTWDDLSGWYGSGGYRSIYEYSDIEIVTSSVDIYTFSNPSMSYRTTSYIAENSTAIFFQRPPVPIVELAISLTKTVQKQTATILPIVVGCLALLIGSLILVPKLKIFVLK